KTIDYSPTDLETWFDAAFLAAFLAASALCGLQQSDYFLTIDGTDRPFYGKSYRRVGTKGKKGQRNRRPEYKDEDLTIAGQNTDPAFTSKGGGPRGRPSHRGTINKHAYLQV